jgi:AcrR family transcriptional regulator
VETRINDIPVAAGLAVGTFYTYFDSKEEILAAVLESVSDAMIHPHLDHLGDPSDMRALIEQNNRVYLMAYRENAGLMRLFEQLAQVDPQFRELRRKRAREFARRSARTIRALQESQRADPNVDPYYAALALAGMVGRMAYTVYVDGERVPFEDLLSTVTDLWVSALHIDQLR